MKTRWKTRVLWTLLAVVVAYMVYISVPYAIHKHYVGRVYGSTSPVASPIPVTINGQVYRGVFQTNEFIGTVKIGPNAYTFNTPRQARIPMIIQHLIHPVPPRLSGYPYQGIVMRIDRQQYAVTSALIQMSGHFNTIKAFTRAISNTYGAQAFYRASRR